MWCGAGVANWQILSPAKFWCITAVLGVVGVYLFAVA
jgi:hypothetical protein